jgi:6-phospho-beta-glucosidase
VQVVNTCNRGTLPFLPDDAVIEVQARVDGTGATPLAVPELDPLYAGLIANVTAYEDLALEAALRGGRATGRAGGREAVFKALLAHPLIGQFEYAEALTDKLIAHNREHLAWA